jgi:hypothetical protein
MLTPRIAERKSFKRTIAIQTDNPTGFTEPSAVAPDARVAVKKRRVLMTARMVAEFRDAAPPCSVL